MLRHNLNESWHGEYHIQGIETNYPMFIVHFQIAATQSILCTIRIHLPAITLLSNYPVSYEAQSCPLLEVVVQYFLIRFRALSPASTGLDRARLKGCMNATGKARHGKQQQQQNSLNVGPTF